MIIDRPLCRHPKSPRAAERVLVAVAVGDAGGAAEKGAAVRVVKR